MMEFSKVKIVTFVPVQDSERVRNALAQSGAGRIGEYSYCSYSVKGNGRFLPSSGANPHVGVVGQINTVEEERIEVVCQRKNAKTVIAAMKETHPYEEVAYDVYPLLEDSQL